jgi:CheY-like chemotaxis protein
VPDVLADSTQIEQALLNLATNAMQAAQGGPQCIEIRLDTVMLDASFADEYPGLRGMRSSPPALTVRLAVRDEGPGMDVATRARIFEPFFTTKPMGEGTGLGLSVVRGIVQAHEGAIVTESQPGSGTTFTLYFPTATAADAVHAPGASVATVEQSCGNGRSLLYIDDDEAMVFLVKRLLERRGYRVSAFVDAREALEVFRADPRAFVSVISDYNMPYLSGLDVAHAVRAIRADIPVVIVSGFIDDRLLSQSKNAGVRELLVKTLDVTEFCEAIHRHATDAPHTPPP